MVEQLIAAGIRAQAAPAGVCRLYLVRHGTTTMNVENRYRGRRDIPLDAQGYQDAVDAARRLSTADVAAVYTGPLRRTIATAQINKRALFLGGYSFLDNKEFLAHLTSTDDYAMGFVAANLRVVLISTHVPLSQAIGLVRRERFEKTIRLAHHELQRWGIENPRIAAAALNPHGAEGGLFGIEEASEILPAVESCKVMDRINVSGPYSADTVFLRASRGEFDAVIACYHDQAMIPVKCLSFGEAVNVTLGLPFIRTSVDHGTAFDIAGKGIAEHSSMVAAIKLAAELSLKSGESGRAVEAA